MFTPTWFAVAAIHDILRFQITEHQTSDIPVAPQN